MARKIRPFYRSLIKSYGLKPHELLRMNVQRSSICKTVVVDGKVTAIGGVNSDFVGDSCFVWVVLSENSDSIKFRLIREIINQIKDLFLTKTRILTLIDKRDKKAMRLLEFLGFEKSKGDDQVILNSRNSVMMEIIKIN